MYQVELALTTFFHRSKDEQTIDALFPPKPRLERERKIRLVWAYVLEQTKTLLFVGEV